MKKLVALLVCILIPGFLHAWEDDGAIKTATPIKHLTVIFDENNSFDHYFATYPNAQPNLDGSIFFGKPKNDTPIINGLSPTLLTNNPNSLTGGSNPFRLDRSQAATCNNSNAYTLGQRAFDSGLMDQFKLTAATTPCGFFLPPPGQFLSMGYYDGNTVTALWNYAQQYAMSDNFFDTTFGGTVQGHLNLLSGQTNGLNILTGPYASPMPVAPAAATNTINNGTIVANVNPFYDDCGGPAPNVAMTGKNVGDLLNAAGISWGWFYGDFAAASTTNGVATCIAQYNPHYAPFGYYLSTSNPHHVAPISVASIGRDTCTGFVCANHQYDLNSFYQALTAGSLPAVSFLKFAEDKTGHPRDSTPLEEQAEIVKAVNAIQQSPFWNSAAILITYDDGDGWYDHVAAPIINFSEDPVNDAITGTPAPAGGTGSCGHPVIPSAIQGRCGFGQRLPFLLISPFARRNYVDHSINDLTSILRFIESNWNLGTIGDPQSFDVLASGTILGMFDFSEDDGGHKLILDPITGQP